MLYTAEDSAVPVGVLELDHPLRDNLHLVWVGITVHPDHRRRGHGSAMLEEAIHRTKEMGRSTVWLGAAEDDLGARAFMERFGFSFASHDARRLQRLAEVDQAGIDVLYASAQQAAADYVIERGTAPTGDDILADLVQVTAAINDAPMGDLSYEEEKFDLQRLKDVETAAAGRRDTLYRIWARHRSSGEIGGHTVMVTNRLRPEHGGQGDTAVSREHRGHRLGMLLKIEMMRWLAEVEPQLDVIETWNNADNSFMINVNEAIGYRLSRVFALYQLILNPAAAPIPARIAASVG
jgi:RimJ/RimL family protein N-acetyltransferase